jgi:excisionase family DNA binding protein
MERLAYPVHEAAELLGIGRTKVYAEIAAGRIESVTVGSRRLVPYSALEAYIERLRIEQRGSVPAA